MNFCKGRQTLIANAEVFIHAIDGQASLTIYAGTSNARAIDDSMHTMDLDRDTLLKLQQQIEVALAAKPPTEEELRNRADHQAWWIEKEYGYGNRGN